MKHFLKVHMLPPEYFTALLYEIHANPSSTTYKHSNIRQTGNIMLNQNAFNLISAKHLTNCQKYNRIIA